MHLNVCNQQWLALPPASKPRKTLDYAVSLMNAGQYRPGPCAHEKILRADPKADFAFMAWPWRIVLPGQVEGALKNLSEAIRLNPQNRFQIPE